MHLPRSDEGHAYYADVTTGLSTWSLPPGAMVLPATGALAEFERNLIRERTMAGLRAARARGRVGGRPRKLDEKKTELAYQLYDEKKYAVKEICQILEISKPTLYAYLQRRNENSQG